MPQALCPKHCYLLIFHCLRYVEQGTLLCPACRMTFHGFHGHYFFFITDSSHEKKTKIYCKTTASQKKGGRECENIIKKKLVVDIIIHLEKVEVIERSQCRSRKCPRHSE